MTYGNLKDIDSQVIMLNRPSNLGFVIFPPRNGRDMADHYFCDFYRHIKPNFGREIYLAKLNHIQRNSLCRFRCRSNCLPITKLRFGPNENSDIFCPLCSEKSIGHEMHFLLRCSFFNLDRQTYIPSNFSLNTNFYTIRILLCTHNIELLRNVANFAGIVMDFFYNTVN